MILDIGLAGLVMVVAIWTIAARAAFASVTGFVAYGLLLSLVWVRLAAPDVALTEAAIGSGLTGALLIRASAVLRRSETLATLPGLSLRIAAGVLCVVVTLALAAVVLMLPDPAPSLAPLAAANLPPIGVGNAITGVLLAYRALDTMLEKVVLLLALLGVWSLAPNALWGGRPGVRHETDPDGILTFLAQILPPAGVVIGIYILWVGADEPGGAFQGGTILAAMWMLTMMAGLTDAPPISRRWLRIVLISGPALFLAVGLGGFAMAGHFLAYPVGFAKPLILLIEFALTLSIAALLGLLMAGPPERAPEL